MKPAPRPIPPLALALTLAVGSASCGGADRPPTRHGGAEPVEWSEWGREAFERARATGRPILLSVQAGWCHWCHVMNDTTYRDPRVVERLREGFVVIRADADARPDLAQRYQRWGWPATVFLTPRGERILALRGHRDPERFSAILQRVADAAEAGERLDEDEGAAGPPSEDLEQVRAELIAQLDRMYDAQDAGWGRRQRYPLSAPVEHAFFRAAVRGEDRWRQRALASLERYAELIDPVFGGMYQYSVRGAWDRPHFEKIVPVQAGAIAAFAEAYRVTAEPRWLERAEEVRRYVASFLRAPDGAFYASQDADLGGHGQPGPHLPGERYYALDGAGRRALGVPRIDRHVYASHNGMLIEALAELHVASGRRGPLSEATGAAERLLGTHRHPSGLFVHDADADDPLLYLADQAHLLAAFVALHQASGQARWLDEAQRLAHALAEHLFDETTGSLSSATEDPRAAGFFREPAVPIAETGTAARALIALSRLSHGEDAERWRRIAERALLAAARPEPLRRLGRMVGEYLLALETLRADYVLLSVVGPDEPATASLFEAAVGYYHPTRLVELGRPGDSRYPYPGEPAAFLCSGEACSMPVTDPDAIPAAARAFMP